MAQTSATLFEAGARANSSSTDVTAALLLEGGFHDVAHKSMGNAAVHQLADGKRVLRFTRFETSNGPDLHVYLVANADANDNETVTRAGFVDAGPLKGNIGDQNHDLPSEINFGNYRSVSIWCKRFGVNFATAPLTSR